MKLKLSNISAAIGLLAVAGSAFAVPGTGTAKTDISNFTTGTADIYLAGSSAVDLALVKFIANSCDTSTMDSYQVLTGGKTYYLWTCYASGASPFAGMSSSKIAIHKNTNSSSDGVALVANGAATAVYLTPADISAGCATAAYVNVPATATIPAYNKVECGGTPVPTFGALANLGFSDSEPNQFSTSLAPQVTSAFPFSLIFGIPVTTNVRDLLQTAQGLVAGSETEANMPSISAAQINAIYTGRFTNWTALGITVGADNAIYRLRRSNGSGTSRAFDAAYMGDFCVPGLTAISSGTTLVTTTIATQCNLTGAGGTRSLQAGTSEDVESCLNQWASVGAGAIAYLSTDFQPSAASGYRWLKVDGVAPKQLNVIDNKYDFWSELSVNYNSAAGIAGDVLVLHNALKNFSASATLVSEVASNLTQTTSGGWTGGLVGALANSKNLAGWGLPAAASLATPRTDASVLAAPANPFTRAQTTGYNLCSKAFPASGYKAQ
jgi:ABC-type phosphate transport system substrate-binding protein